MRRALDTNVLIIAHLASLPGHGPVRSFLTAQLQRDDVTLVVTPVVLHEFVHVITDPRRFDPPVSMADAVSLARLYLDAGNVECIPIDEPSLIRTFELLLRHRLGRKRIADTLLYATIERHGVDDLVTCNPDDFRVFADLPLVDPRTAR